MRNVSYECRDKSSTTFKGKNEFYIFANRKETSNEICSISNSKDFISYAFCLFSSPPTTRIRLARSRHTNQKSNRVRAIEPTRRQQPQRLTPPTPRAPTSSDPPPTSPPAGDEHRLRRRWGRRRRRRGWRLVGRGGRREADPARLVHAVGPQPPPLRRHGRRPRIRGLDGSVPFAAAPSLLLSCGVWPGRDSVPHRGDGGAVRVYASLPWKWWCDWGGEIMGPPLVGRITIMCSSGLRLHNATCGCVEWARSCLICSGWFGWSGIVSWHLTKVTTHKMFRLLGVLCTEEGLPAVDAVSSGNVGWRAGILSLRRGDGDKVRVYASLPRNGDAIGE